MWRTLWRRSANNELAKIGRVQSRARQQTFLCSPSSARSQSRTGVDDYVARHGLPRTDPAARNLCNVAAPRRSRWRARTRRRAHTQGMRTDAYEMGIRRDQCFRGIERKSRGVEPTKPGHCFAPTSRTAFGSALRHAGFPVLDTAGDLHWTIVLADTETATLDRLRAVFSPPFDNPGFVPPRRR